MAPAGGIGDLKRTLPGAIGRAPCGCIGRASRGLYSSRREHVDMPIEPAGDNIAIVANPAGVGKECKGRIQQIVQVDQPAPLYKEA